MGVGSHPQTYATLPRKRLDWMQGAISLRAVLNVVGEFDQSGGASVGLVAWELCVEESLVAGAWEQARVAGLIAPAGYDQHEQLWRLTPAGRAESQSDCENA
jgi:hypothetical protein